MGTDPSADLTDVATAQAMVTAGERPVRLTATVDASHRADRGVTGIGIVLRASDRPGRAGPELARISEQHDGVPAGEIELFAVLRALEHARARGFRRVKVRSDYSAMRRRLKADHAAGRNADAGTLHGRVLLLARTFDDVYFGYQPRRRNQVAHGLARAATFEPEARSRPGREGWTDGAAPSARTRRRRRRKERRGSIDDKASAGDGSTTDRAAASSATAPSASDSTAALRRERERHRSTTEAIDSRT
jgi:ribonuclease HI